jgi:hypothetical protein
VVLRVNVLVTVVNIVLDYLWIFGHLGFPRAGVAGAAGATIAAEAFGALVYLMLILRAEYRRRYATLAGWRLDPALFGRLLRFGLPAGLHWAIEILGFGVFLLLVGRIGTLELAATGLAFNLNGLVFVPMLGLGIGVTAIVGRYLGSGRPDLAERSDVVGDRAVVRVHGLLGSRLLPGAAVPALAVSLGGGRGGVRAARRAHRGAAALRRGLLDLRHAERGLRGGAARCRGHRVRDVVFRVLRRVRDAAPDLARRPLLERGHLRRVGGRQRLRLLRGNLAVPALPPGRWKELRVIEAGAPGALTPDVA